MSEEKNPYILTEEQKAKMKEYCQSDEFINHINKRYRERKEKEREEHLRHIEWWLRIKDIPFM